MTGTFYLNDNDIKLNIELVDQFRKAGNIFTIATGNNYESFIKVIQKYDIKYDYLILDQGSLIIDSNNKVINTCYIEKNIVKAIIKEINSKKKLNNSYYNGSLKICNLWTENSNPNDNITKIGLQFKDLSQAKRFTNYIKDKYHNKINAYTMIFTGTYTVEIISSETSKTDAIEVLTNYEKIDKANIYTIGNGYNDIEMISRFNGYCMKNSVEELLNICNRQVTSVAELLEKLLGKVKVK